MTCSKVIIFEPFAIEDASSVRIENLDAWAAVAFRVVHHLLVRQLRTCNGTTARIADHRGEIADDEHRLMTQILKLPQLSQNDRVAEMNIRTRRIDAEFYAQWAMAA